MQILRAPLSLNFLMLVPSLKETSGRDTVFHNKMAENVPVAAQRFNAVFPAIMCLYCAAIFFDVFDKMLRTLAGDAGDGYTFESGGPAIRARRARLEGKRFVERERAGDGVRPERSQKGGRGMPVLLRTREARRRIGGVGDEGRVGGGDDVESRGLLNRRAARSDERAESRAERWERNKERLANAVGRGAGNGSGLAGGNAVGSGGGGRRFLPSLSLGRGARGGAKTAARRGATEAREEISTGCSRPSVGPTVGETAIGDAPRRANHRRSSD